MSVYKEWKGWESFDSFTLVSKDDCTCLNENVSKECFSSPLMHWIAPSIMFLCISSEKYIPGSSVFY